MAYKAKDVERPMSTDRPKFNPAKYGKVWNTMSFEHMWNRVPVGEAKQPVIGKLLIGGKVVELTFTECNKLIETLEDAKYSYNVGTRLGRSDNGWKI
jgi:hypothetical protein